MISYVELDQCEIPVHIHISSRKKSLCVLQLRTRLILAIMRQKSFLSAFKTRILYRGWEQEREERRRNGGGDKKKEEALARIPILQSYAMLCYTTHLTTHHCSDYRYAYYSYKVLPPWYSTSIMMVAVLSRYLSPSLSLSFVAPFDHFIADRPKQTIR